MKTNGYEVKNVKTFVGMEGEGFNASLYKDGVRIAFVMDEATGGPYSYQWDDRKADKVKINDFDLKGDKITYMGTPFQKELVDFMNTLPPIEDEHSDEPMRVDLDIFVGHLVDDFEHTKWLKRQCKKKTLFRLKGDPEDEYKTVTHPFNGKVKEFLEKKYGEQVQEIINERF